MITNLLIDHVEVSGRLGNNLFQIALLIGLEKKYGYNYFIPQWKHSKDFKKLRYNTNITLKPKKTYIEPSFKYTEIGSFGDILGDLIDFRGYFQSWKYFDFCRETILDSFSFNPEVIFQAKKYLKDNFLDPSSVVCMHLRRTDYLSKQHYHTNLLESTSYYIEAMKIFKKENKKFLIFSDDIEFCKRIFGGVEGVFFSENNEILDLCLMSLCSNFIIANSSFSWWGAYLSQDPNKFVIAPNKWFETNIDTSDLIPKEWRLL